MSLKYIIIIINKKVRDNPQGIYNRQFASGEEEER